MNSQPPLILIVDDHPVMRKLLTVAMEEEGYRVIDAKDGEQGIREFERHCPDMVLLDALMPEMDGFSCCQRLRSYSDGENTPILMITALDDQESIDQAFNAGASDYVTKPIYWSVLSKRVKRMLDSHQALQQLKQITHQRQSQQQWEQTLGEATESLSHPFKLNDWLKTLIANVSDVTQADRVFFCPATGNISLEVLKKKVASVSPLSWREISLLPLYGNDYLHGKVVTIDDLAHIEAESDLIAPLQNLSTQSLVMVPALMRERIQGVLGIHGCQKVRTWQPWEIQQFEQLKRLLAIAFYQSEYIDSAKVSRLRGARS